ncbi:MAG: HAD-IA family hydrolase [candidate division Zixibacteria bacterium]|nr:HAD-IA family hydrolase [candidate division Zixibacteria bacterium]
MSEIKAILFDLGSTLLEYEKFEWQEIARRGMIGGYQFLMENSITAPPIETCGRVFHEVYTQWSEEGRDELIEVNFQEAVVEAFRRLELSTDKDLVFDFIQAYYQPISDDVEELEGASETLRELKSLGLTLVIVSNSVFPAYLHLKELRRYHILPYIDGMVFSCEIGVRKPHPDMYITGLEIAGCNVEEAVFVGDRFLEDVQGPEEIGLKGILRIKPGREYPPEIEKYPSVNSVTEIKNLLELGG